MQDERSKWAILGVCLTYIAAYFVLSACFFYVTSFLIVLIDRATSDSPYDMGEYSGIGYGFISLGLSFFVLAPLTLIGVSLYNTRLQQRKQKEKRKHDSVTD